MPALTLPGTGARATMSAGIGKASRALPSTTENIMTGTANALDDDDGNTSSIPVSMPQLFLYTGEVSRDPTSTPEGRHHAERVFNELIAVCVAHGFTRARQLRALCADGHYSTPQASMLARTALDLVPADKLRAALDRAGFPR
jgi:hypothetical protein